MSRSPWWPAAAWAAAVFVGNSIPGDALARVPAGLDKLVHFALYAVLGVLVGRALRGGGAAARSAVGVIAALGAIAGFAALDELHQTFVPGRSTDWIDWLADVIGAAAGLRFGAPSTLRSEQQT